jgi:hypothetical protein
LVVQDVGVDKSVAEILEFVEANDSPITRGAISASIDSIVDATVRDGLRRGLLDSKLRGYVGAQLVENGSLDVDQVGTEWLIRANVEMLWIQIEMEISPVEDVVKDIWSALPPNLILDLLESIEEPWAGDLLERMSQFVDANYKKKIRKILMNRL